MHTPQTPATNRADYVRGVLTLYCELPHTAARRPSPCDRRLAEQLFDQGIPMATVEAACLLAIARRAARPADLPPLPLVRSLAYFLPVVEELGLDLPDPRYLAYLRSRATSAPR
jgi:hypothetical protein